MEDSRPRALLEHRTKLVTPREGFWRVGLFPEAAEASGGFHSAGRASGGGPRAGGETVGDAARHAKTRVRRYCVANGLNRLGTLTYAGAGKHDPRALRADIGVFFRRLRGSMGEPFPYLWTAEWHKSGHGLHVHFGVGRFIRRSWIEGAWGRGFVHIKLLGDLPAGPSVLRESRATARYLAKYVTKDMDRHPLGLHRYEVAQGFQPSRVDFTAPTALGGIAQASEAMGRQPARIWHSSEVEDWGRPAAVWAQWDA